MTGAGATLAAGDASRVAEVRVPARAECLAIVRATVRATVESLGCNALADDVVLAVDEACQNVVRHAYGENEDGDLEVHLGHTAHRLVVEVRDFAAPVDPDAVSGRDLEDVEPGGLGVHLIYSVMDEARFLPAPPGVGNLFRMAKHLALTESEHR